MVVTQSLAVEADSTILLTSSQTLTFAGAVTSSTGTLHVLGHGFLGLPNGTLELATSSAYTGGLSVDSTTLIVSNATVLAGTSGTLGLKSSTFRTTATFSTNTHITLLAGNVFVVGNDTT